MKWDPAFRFDHSTIKDNMQCNRVTVMTVTYGDDPVAYRYTLEFKSDFKDIFEVEQIVNPKCERPCSS